MSAELIQPIAWRPDFTTGVGIIDDQHRVLIKMLNEASTRLTDQSSLEELAKIVQGLINYADYHFKTEERFIVEQGYERLRPVDAEAHLAQHRDFVSKVLAVREQIHQGQRVPKDVLVSFLSEWLTHHILHTDKALGAFLLDQKQRAAQ
ncbi:Bacteriohemerythrin [Candidatus Magnetaquicoccaceae bacterium FCR-1]|uniref:Bacteriohemerythrin n=1 Tax=Candidatus Magnetaquiglobus chichijimensis TaxID=3141448 RepID=A0ABQ0C9M0_9PROT